MMLINEAIKEIAQRYKPAIRKSSAVLISAVGCIIVIASFEKFAHIFPALVKVILGIALIEIMMILLYAVPSCEKMYRILKNMIFVVATVAIFIFVFLFVWYTVFFFPDDEKYLKQITSSLIRQKAGMEFVEVDLVRDIHSARISNPLSDADVKFLLSDELRNKEFYIDPNPYQPTRDTANLKYATGRIFYYTSQKNCIVLKANSTFEYSLGAGRGNGRFLEFDVVYPSFDGRREDGGLTIEYDRKPLRVKTIPRERKPVIAPFRYSNVVSSIWFYLNHPGRSVLTEYTGWERMRIELPASPGVVRMRFASSDASSYLFVGTPRVYAGTSKKSDSHLNIAYIIFDCLAKNHLDIYEFYDLFKKHGPDIAMKMIPARDLITPSIDKYFNEAILFDAMFSAGQVTRPSIVSLWTSRPYTESRLPVFRNIVTKENQEEFYRMNFAALGDLFSAKGYLTKQISCNAQGHGVSSVGVDLGFDENYDYTMETSEHPENIRRIVEFFQENQNRKFLLYAHINTPHSPSWVPLGYYLKALWDTDFRHGSAVALANVRYLNSHLERIFEAAERLGLRENTLFIITADHSFARHHKFRSFVSEEEAMWARQESTDVAYFHPRAVYRRKGGPNLYRSTMNIPFVMIPPKGRYFVPGKIAAVMSTLDVAPTLLDLALDASESRFSGKSFKRMLNDPLQREGVFSDFIPLVGRFQRAFIFEGRYMYWRDLAGLYRYQHKHGKKYLMQPERLYDLKHDPCEITNLMHDAKNKALIKKMRKLYDEKFQDYPDKTFVQIIPKKDGKMRKFQVEVSSSGRIIYPRTYCEKGSFAFLGANHIKFEIDVRDKHAMVSFETDPPQSPIEITVLRDSMRISEKELFISQEKLSGFSNPLRLKSINDFHICRISGKTGLEAVSLPENSVYVYRIPLNFWLEMNTGEKDIQLSPGIKEVLRGWGYIQ